MADFNGIVYLTEDQYIQLKNDGSLTVEDVTVNFDENTLYVTPQIGTGEGGGTIVTVGGVEVETLTFNSDPQTQITNNNTKITELELDLMDVTNVANMALKLPNEAPASVSLVAVNNTNKQELLTIGEGLSVVNGSLVATGIDFEVIDDVTSSSSTAALSANQGKILNSKIQTISDNYLTLNTAQTITSKKTFTQNNIVMKANNIDLNNPPTDKTAYSFIDFVDKNDNRIGIIGAQFTQNGYAGIYLQARNTNSISIRAKEDGTIIASVPTPDASSNSTNIANTQWVNTNVNGKVNNFSMIPKNVYSTQTITTSGTQITAPVSGYLKTQSTGNTSDGYMSLVSSSGIVFTQNASKGNYPVYYIPVNKNDKITINFNGTNSVTASFIQTLQL